MPPGRRRTSFARPGYTLAEVFVALCLVGIVAGFTAPRLNWARWEADAAARQLRYTLQTAQRLAVTEQATVIVGVDSANRRVRVLEDLNGSLAQDGTPLERIRWMTLDGDARFLAPSAPIPGETPGGALVNISARIVDGLPSIVFRRDGSASATATLYVRSRRWKDTEFRGITVTQATGRIAWWRASAPTMSWLRGTL